MSLLVVPPQVVGTINPRGLAALARLPAAERVVDIVEARLDLAMPAAGTGGAAAGGLPDLDAFWEPCARLEASGTPVLATIRLVADGGRWTEDAGRLSDLSRALAVASWIDIELESAIATSIVARAHAAGRRAIVSHHDFGATPPVDDLTAMIERARALGADIVKVATVVDSLEAHDRLIDLLRVQRSAAGAPVALVGMGPIGTPLRAYLPSVGSRLAYGYMDEVAAPGQVHAADLVRRLTADCPAYAEQRRLHGAL